MIINIMIIVGCLAVDENEASIQQTERFLYALNKGDYKTAFAICDEDLKKQYIDEENMASIIIKNGIQPQAWRNLKIEEELATQPQKTNKIIIKGEILTGFEGEMEVQLIKRHREWKIHTYIIQAKKFKP